jgi:RNA polymerase sigma-70 factor (ECF subfamily)
LRPRTNDEWLHELRSDGGLQAEALADLREYLRYAALFYLRRRGEGLRDVSFDEIEALAEDSAQEGLVAVLEKLDTFRGEARFLTWAGKFSVGRAIMSLRRRQWRDASLDRVPDGWTGPAFDAVSTDGWDHPELAARRQEIWQVIREVANNDLTDLQRQAFIYILVEGAPAQIAAERLGMTPNALYKLTHDARRKLKKSLEQRGWSVEEILSAFAATG